MLWIENFGKRIFTSEGKKPEQFRTELDQFISYLRSSHRSDDAFILEYVDGVRPTESEFSEALHSLGFYREKAQTMRFELR